MKQFHALIQEQIKNQQLNHFPIDFQAELDQLLKMIPTGEWDIKDIIRTVQEAKIVGARQSPQNLERLFYHYMILGDLERALITFFDHREARQAKDKAPASPLMCQFMMIVAGKKKDPLLIKSIYRDIQEIPRLKFSRLMTTILLKSFSLFGEVKILLECYERLYQFGHLPEPVHWYCMLKGTSRCGDPKHFARFFYRLVKKDLTPSKEVLVALLAEWGQNEDWGWKRSQACNLKEFDYAYLVDIAQRTHNYKLAFRMVQDVYNLDKQPTFQLYEMFLKGVSRDLPKFRHDVRTWKARFATKYGSVDKATVLEFEEWMKTIKEHIGEENMSNVPIAPTIPRIKNRFTRKEFLIQNNLMPPKVRFTSKFTDDSRLFEYVPEYLRRLERESEQYQARKKQEEAERKAAADIELAREKETEWRQIGFRGEESVAPDALRKKLTEITYPQFSSSEFKRMVRMVSDYQDINVPEEEETSSAEMNTKPRPSYDDEEEEEDEDEEEDSIEPDSEYYSNILEEEISGSDNSDPLGTAKEEKEEE
eukprot:TRINITY_DN1472_c0_g2_i1.p1 TRINITY_DN1472_c0_g2~~TRINITY_DN1472_c0_g2_i1.p1  ORF type:complete len:626 (+),score=136.70 TRINITY_DN1472_c0_g2_i1:272-1879(+)